VDADGHVLISADCLLDVQLSPGLPPDLVLKPEVVTADIQLSGLHVNRVSHLEGALARELSGTMQSIINKKLDDKRPKLVAKLNRQIAKHEDDLRFSLSDSIKARWSKFTGDE
ncbi:MAG: hypothetical protein KDB23_16700, partial [Planctomycetales bacterium]|nr:hypothetical protein [Planctomycetales bacterium]